MSDEKAKAHYLGKDGHQKLNCAQAIVQAFKDEYALPEGVVEKFAVYGGGRAPEGVCGSLYAARIIFGNERPENIQACEAALLAKAGSIKCREIRAANKLSCVGCVETIARQLEK